MCAFQSFSLPLSYLNPYTIHIMRLFHARIVGGAIRDALLKIHLGLKSTLSFLEDLDLATPLTTNQMIEIARNNNLTLIPTGIDHGTVTIVPFVKDQIRALNENNSESQNSNFSKDIHIQIKHYEITTLRKDIETDGRHAKVEFVTCWKEDAKRRDFTINALYADEEGRIYDYFDGLKDLKEHKVRFIGDPYHRIQEDYLRIMRFFRFTAHYADDINMEGYKAIMNSLQGLKNISKERIYKELYKTLSGKKVNMVLVALKDVLSYIRWPVPQFIESINHFMNPLLILSLFKGDWAEFKLSNKDLQFINNLRNVRLENKPDWLEARYKYGQKWIESKLDYEKIVHDCNKEQAIYWLEAFQEQAFPITGQDLISKGLKGVEIGQKMKQLMRIWFENDMLLTQADLLKSVQG